MWNQIVLLFSEMGTIPAICLLAGLALIIVEIFEPGFGVFGSIGGILTIVGIVIRVVDSGSANAFALLFLMLIIISAIIALAFLLMVRLSRSGWLTRISVFDNKTAIDPNFSEGTADYSFLIGKKGIANTSLRPSGYASIDGQNYDVVAEGFYIAKDELIVVTQIEGVKVVVKREDK